VTKKGRGTASTYPSTNIGNPVGIIRGGKRWIVERDQTIGGKTRPQLAGKELKTACREDL